MDAPADMALLDCVSMCDGNAFFNSSSISYMTWAHPVPWPSCATTSLSTVRNTYRLIWLTLLCCHLCCSECLEQVVYHVSVSFCQLTMQPVPVVGGSSCQKDTKIPKRLHSHEIIENNLSSSCPCCTIPYFILNPRFCCSNRGLWSCASPNWSHLCTQTRSSGCFLLMIRSSQLLQTRAVEKRANKLVHQQLWQWRMKLVVAQNTSFLKRKLEPSLAVAAAFGASQELDFPFTYGPYSYFWPLLWKQKWSAGNL